jgi:hypothetical protein
LRSSSIVHSYLAASASEGSSCCSGFGRVVLERLLGRLAPARRAASGPIRRFGESAVAISIDSKQLAQVADVRDIREVARDRVLQHVARDLQDVVERSSLICTVGPRSLRTGCPASRRATMRRIDLSTRRWHATECAAVAARASAAPTLVLAADFDGGRRLADSR